MDIELILHAKEYIDKMANGVNPITGEPADDNDMINNVRISRCLFYVSSVLQEVIDNPVRPKGEKKIPFSVTYEQLKDFPFNDKMTISVIVDNINKIALTDNMCKLTTTKITGWFLENGILSEQIGADGKKHRLPTEQGKDLGISTEERQGMYGMYLLVTYNKSAQQFIIDNMEAILSTV